MHVHSFRTAALTAITLAVFGAEPGKAALDETACRLVQDALAAAFGQCATLTVPEDYARPDGREIDLFVARIPALTADPAPDPLVLINGGPGGSTVDLYLQAGAAFERVRRQRDIYLLDQRGTGRSLAGLDCEIRDDFDLTTATDQEIRETVEGCIDEFEFDPRFFTTSVAVRDLESLREAIGADEWNVYGVSYGTRVAQHYLRRFPDRVRTTILDGVVPAELTLGPQIATDAQAALDAILARCAEDSGCSERFPDISTQFDELRRRFSGDSVEVLIEDPTTGEPKSLEINESHLQGVIRFMSYSDLTAALLPLIIDAAYQGNYVPLAAQAELQIAAVAESIGFAMHNSVICTEDAPWFPANPAPDAALLYLGSTVIDGLRTICDIWPAGEIDPDFKEPVASDRPVLLLSGEHDPVTPPANAERVIAGGLSHSRHIVGRAQGHGLAAVGCMPRLISEFIEDADPSALDRECLDAEPPMPFFLSFQGPEP